MNDSSNTPLSQKDNEDKVVSKNIQENKKSGKKRIQKGLLIIIFSAVLLCAFVLSTVLNERIAKTTLVNERNYNYKTIPSTYAVITPSDRTKFFKAVGFAVSREETVSLNGRNYITTFAYNKYYNEIDDPDNIRVYYDNNYKVFRIELNLIYKSDDLKVENFKIDANNILKNFVNIDIDNEPLIQAKENDSYYQKLSRIKSSANYTLTKIKGVPYYILNITVEKN